MGVCSTIFMYFVTCMGDWNAMMTNRMRCQCRIMFVALRIASQILLCVSRFWNPFSNLFFFFFFFFPHNFLLAMA
jgi:hypothetical protein